MEQAEVVKAVETLLFVAKNPLQVSDLVSTLEQPHDQVLAAVKTLQENYQHHAIQIIEVAHGFQMATRKEHAHLVEKFLNSPTEVSLTPAALEALAIIAYRQPVSKGDIEAIRGVNSDAVIKSLLDKGLIEDLGKSNNLGRPTVYGTTDEFLKHFGLKDLQNLLPVPGLDQQVAIPPIKTLQESEPV
jgi:segregation and condensation protein B